MPPETTRPQAETRTITVSGQHLRVATRSGNGTRTPLLMMNGIGVNLEVLQSFVDALDPAIEVIRFDVPGTGGSPPPLIPYRFSILSRLVTKMLDQLGYQQVDVLGVSWGGALAQQFAFQYPRRCRRLILVSTGTGALMVPGRPSVLAKIATPRRYQDPAYMAQIAGEIYGGKARTQPELAHDFAHTARLGSVLGYFYQLLGERTTPGDAQYIDLLVTFSQLPPLPQPMVYNYADLLMDARSAQEAALALRAQSPDVLVIVCATFSDASMSTREQVLSKPSPTGLPVQAFCLHE